MLRAPQVRRSCRHTILGKQKLATAFQSVDIDQNPLKSPEATAFHWDAQRSTLFSAGGVLPSTVFAWDLRHESIYTTLGDEHAMLSAYQSPPYSIAFLQGSSLGADSTPLLFAGCTDGVVRLFDLRDSRGGPVSRLHPHDSALQGLAFRLPHILVTACNKALTSELAFTDVRMASQSHEPRCAPLSLCTTHCCSLATRERTTSVEAWMTCPHCAGWGVLSSIRYWSCGCCLRVPGAVCACLVLACSQTRSLLVNLT